ncbi:hypothetical protein [Porphyromonas sp.]|uniref:hypothetical protein n=1 Tax=Porphyromonas sp. TaxID=1924944 RepID=UPI0026DD73D8|nr:hypothetical protein [Porphyromonas sp.]MDO4695398.1 hypothetical protein [Porphyromonas sp.]MDO4770475.1 hypothetical protein [Porphyromonas sp.]
MVTSVIGKIFLEAYNKKNGTDYDPKRFFVEVYYPLFFNQEKYMMTAGNSPFENPKISWTDMILGKKPFETPEKRQERFDRFIEKTDGSLCDASIAIGYPTVDFFSTTSGQVSIPQKENNPEEAYLSWIGAGLGVGVQGGMSILFSHTDILLDIFEGWKVYRKYLNETPNMKGNQINTWNGQWLKKLYDKIDTSQNFLSALSEKDGIISVETIPWAELLIAISSHLQNPKVMGYVYNIGQTNTTIGFIPFALSHIRIPYELYIDYFGADDIEDASELFGTAIGFTMACREGVIGIKALEPKGLRPYMEKGKMPSFKNDNKEQTIQFRTYQIWLLAMLNNDQLWDKSTQFANFLSTYTKGGKSGRTGRSNEVKSLLTAVNQRSFIEKLIPIVEEAENKEEITEIAGLINKMPADNVPYFLTLLRFHYAAINNNQIDSTQL